MVTLEKLGSLRFATVILAVLLVVVVYVYRIEAASGWLLALPFALFAINLTAAVATQPKFRTQGWLLAFHVALLLLVLLVAIGRLTYLSAHAEVLSGQAFTGELLGIAQGPFHPGHYRELRFVNESFEIDYLPGPRRDRTRNPVYWVDDDGVTRRAVIGDHVPLVLEGYRFTTTWNKGFAMLLTWSGIDGTVSGAVHLPSWPANEFTQKQEWMPPGARHGLWLQLQFDDPILAEEAHSNFRIPEDPTLVVRLGEARWKLLPGETISLGEGVLRFDGVTTWMGYKVFYDPTIPWLLAVSVIAVVCLAGHFLGKYRKKGWQTTGSAQPTGG